MTPSLSETRPVWGDGVRTLRGIRGLTQAELATQALTNQVTISDIENGHRRNIRDALRVRIAHALEVDPYELFPYVDDAGAVVPVGAKDHDGAAA